MTDRKPSAGARDAVVFVAGELACSFTRAQQLQAAHIIDQQAVAPELARVAGPLAEALERVYHRMMTSVTQEGPHVDGFYRGTRDGRTMAEDYKLICQALAAYKRKMGDPS